MMGKTTPGADAPARIAPLRRSDDFDRDVWSVLGVPVDRMTPPEALATIKHAARAGERLSFVTPNVNFLVRATRDENERRRIIDADLSLVDGAPLVWFGRWLGMSALTRCAGSDIFEALRKAPSFGGRGLRVFFFGGRDGAAEAASSALQEEDRGLQSAGWLNPGFGGIDAMSGPEIIGAINAAAPDFLVVALGASKGQAWIDANLDRLTAPVVAHLGAVIDFTAGSIARAPAFMRRLNLEWAWRILAEPGLWRRYWDDAVALAGLCFGRLLPALAGGRRTGRRAEARVVAETGATRILLEGDLCGIGLERRAKTWNYRFFETRRDHQKTGASGVSSQTPAALGAVRAAFRAASRGSGEAILDFTHAGRIDAAFHGQVLMLEKSVRRRGAALKIAGASPSIRRQLKAHSMVYLRAAAAVAPDREPGEAGIAAEG